MQNTAQWITIFAWLATGAVVIQHYKAGAILAAITGVFVYLGDKKTPDPLAVGVIVFYGAGAVMAFFILRAVWQWLGKEGW